MAVFRSSVSSKSKLRCFGRDFFRYHITLFHWRASFIPRGSNIFPKYMFPKLTSVAISVRGGIPQLQQMKHKLGEQIIFWRAEFTRSRFKKMVSCGDLASRVMFLINHQWRRCCLLMETFKVKFVDPLSECSLRSYQYGHMFHIRHIALSNLKQLCIYWIHFNNALRKENIPRFILSHSIEWLLCSTTVTIHLGLKREI